MDKIEKALSKLTSDERKKIKEILHKLKSGNISGLDIKKLTGRNDIFRVRKGNVRIIFRKEEKRTFILAIERRNDNTYNFNYATAKFNSVPVYRMQAIQLLDKKKHTQS